MIITCPSCKKNFNVDPNLIPEKGRLLKCGTCNETWFFNKYNKETIKYENKKDFYTNNNLRLSKETDYSYNDYKEIDKKIKKISNNKGSELVRYKAKSIFTISKFLSYIIVLIVSFIGLIIVLDTFKIPLSVIFPNLELILYNLYETLKDLFLFAKDLK